MTIVRVLFLVNIVLILLDSSVAYHKAPRFMAFIIPDPEGRPTAVKRLRSLLPLLVALYVSLDCYAYSLRHIGYVAGLTVLLVGDIAVQFFISGKVKAARAE